MSTLNVILINASFCSHGEDDDDDEDPRKKQLRKMFHRLAGDDNEIDAEELQDILTASLRKGIKCLSDIIIMCFMTVACR